MSIEPPSISAYYDRTGWPITQMEWVHLSEDEEYRRIGSDTVGHLWISTVWLGLDHNFMGGPPLIFETMVFDKDAPTEVVDGFSINHQWMDQYMERYATEEAARCGHLATVARYRQIAADEQ